MAWSSFTYTISDGGLTATARVTVTINPVNDAPTLNAIANIMLETSAPQQTIALTGIGQGAPYENQSLSITAQSTNTALIPNPIVTYASPNVTGMLPLACGGAERHCDDCRNGN